MGPRNDQNPHGDDNGRGPERSEPGRGCLATRRRRGDLRWRRWLVGIQRGRPLPDGRRDAGAPCQPVRGRLSPCRIGPAVGADVEEAPVELAVSDLLGRGRRGIAQGHLADRPGPVRLEEVCQVRRLVDPLRRVRGPVRGQRVRRRRIAGDDHSVPDRDVRPEPEAGQDRARVLRALARGQDSTSMSGSLDDGRDGHASSIHQAGLQTEETERTVP